jgi:phosphoribosylanthranilate isomerase
MRESANIAAVAELRPDFLGFIFYPPSPRYAADRLQPELLRALPADVRKIGVFVDETTEQILNVLASYGLDGAQLHGQETPAQCAALRAAGVLVIKSFSVGRVLALDTLRPYEGTCDYYLFDTHGPARGGNGLTFDWELLRAYPLATPYLLAGGLGPEHAAALAALDLPGLAGVDLNSRFESVPGHKETGPLQAILARLRQTRGGRATRRAAQL